MIFETISREEIEKNTARQTNQLAVVVLLIIFFFNDLFTYHLLPSGRSDANAALKFSSWRS